MHYLNYENQSNRRKPTWEGFVLGVQLAVVFGDEASALVFDFVFGNIIPPMEDQAGGLATMDIPGGHDDRSCHTSKRIKKS